MTMADIKITVAPDGTITTKVIGGSGKGCKDLTKALRDALGTTVEDRTLPEYYEQATEGARIKQGGSK
jgi:hypothetical protein